jgi:hypothetical protein
MKTEDYIDKLVAEGKLDRGELNELIEREQAKNPVPALVQASADMAFSLMMVESEAQSAKQDVADLNFTLMMNGVI